jgi:hypothetical protein
MSIERHCQATDHEIRVALDNDANSVALNWANAGIANAGHRDSFDDERSAGRDDLAAMIGCITEPDYVWHVVSIYAN